MKSLTFYVEETHGPGRLARLWFEMFAVVMVAPGIYPASGGISGTNRAMRTGRSSHTVPQTNGRSMSK